MPHLLLCLFIWCKIFSIWEIATEFSWCFAMDRRNATNYLFSTSSFCFLFSTSLSMHTYAYTRKIHCLNKYWFKWCFSDFKLKLSMSHSVCHLNVDKKGRITFGLSWSAIIIWFTGYCNSNLLSAQQNQMLKCLTMWNVFKSLCCVFVICDYILINDYVDLKWMVAQNRVNRNISATFGFRLNRK